MKTLLMLVVIAIGLAACGIKGDPEAPPSFQQAQ